MSATTLSEDLLKGVKSIAEFLGEPERRTSYILETGQIPAGKVGGRWIASKTRLTAHFAEVTSGRAA